MATRTEHVELIHGWFDAKEIAEAMDQYPDLEDVIEAVKRLAEIVAETQAPLDNN